MYYRWWCEHIETRKRFGGITEETWAVKELKLTPGTVFCAIMTRYITSDGDHEINSEAAISPAFTIPETDVVHP